jgi:hypothetical protein
LIIEDGTYWSERTISIPVDGDDVGVGGRIGGGGTVVGEIVR